MKVLLDETTGRAKALRVIELDYSSGKPVEKPGTEIDLEADLIVSAIGQSGDLEGMDDLDNGKGLIAADKFYQVPNRRGLFACGDIIRPHLLTTVIGQGSIAADSIDRISQQQGDGQAAEGRRAPLQPAGQAARGESRAQGVRAARGAGAARDRPRGARYRRSSASRSAASPSTTTRIAAPRRCASPTSSSSGHFPQLERIKRTEIGPSAEEVLGHFAERMVGYTDKQAVDEAKRCMSCGMCFECDNCVIYCPQTAVKRTPKAEATMGRYVYTDYDLCIGCHICADVCPTGYIKMGMGDH